MPPWILRLSANVPSYLGWIAFTEKKDIRTIPWSQKGFLFFIGFCYSCPGRINRCKKHHASNWAYEFENLLGFPILKAHFLLLSYPTKLWEWFINIRSSYKLKKNTRYTLLLYKTNVHKKSLLLTVYNFRCKKYLYYKRKH